MSDKEKKMQLEPTNDHKVFNKFFLYPAFAVFSIRCLWSFVVFLKTGSFESISMLSFLEDYFPKEYSKLYDASDWVGLKMILRTLFTISTPEMFWMLIGAGLDSSVEKAAVDSVSEASDIEDSIAEHKEDDSSDEAEPAVHQSVNQNTSIYVEEDEFTLGNQVRFSQPSNTKTQFKHPEVQEQKGVEADLSLVEGEPFIDKSGVRIVNIRDYMASGPVLCIRDTVTNEIGHFDFSKDIIVGNKEDCDIQWSGIDKGKLVCKFIHQDGKIFLSTCDFAVLLNGKKFSGKCIIENNSVVQVGDFEFIYMSSGAYQIAS